MNSALVSKSTQTSGDSLVAGKVVWTACNTCMFLGGVGLHLHFLPLEDFLPALLYICKNAEFLIYLQEYIHIELSDVGTDHASQSLQERRGTQACMLSCQSNGAKCQPIIITCPLE